MIKPFDICVVYHILSTVYSLCLCFLKKGKCNKKGKGNFISEVKCFFSQEKLKHAGKEMTQENMKYIHVNVK